jgi:hypothetical protein
LATRVRPEQLSPIDQSGTGVAEKMPSGSKRRFTACSLGCYPRMPVRFDPQHAVPKGWDSRRATTMAPKSDKDCVPGAGGGAVITGSRIPTRYDLNQHMFTAKSKGSAVPAAIAWATHENAGG